MTKFKTNWGLNYTLEYFDETPIYQTDERVKRQSTWKNIVWSFLNSGKEMVKIIPPPEIIGSNAAISLSKHLQHNEYPVKLHYFRRGENLYLYREF